MIVSELVTKLQQLPQELRVVVDGYEGGYGDIEKEDVSEVFLKLNQNTQWYYGAHEQVSKGEADCKAVLISR